MRRTPYSPFVENETAPEPWNSGRWGLAGTDGIAVSGGTSAGSTILGAVHIRVNSSDIESRAVLVPRQRVGL
jgi:hypothetical protein